MFKPEYDSEQKFDEGLKKIVLEVKEKIHEKDDDFIIFCTGTTGTGKTALSLHAYELFDPQGCSIDYVGLNKKDHARALKFAKEKKKNRFVIFDEANISRRDHSSQYNKSLIELYFQIRGLQMFHWWSNPSADILDKPFIEERIKGLIFIYTKSKDRPRLYYYFTKKGLLGIWAKEKCLNHEMLAKHASKYALFRGWFKAYDGVLLKPYLEKKKDKMGSAIDSFYDNFGQEDHGEVFTRAKVARMLLVNKSTVARYEKMLDKYGFFVDGEEYLTAANGHRKYTSKGVEVLKKYLADNGRLLKEAMGVDEFPSSFEKGGGHSTPNKLRRPKADNSSDEEESITY